MKKIIGQDHTRTIRLQALLILGLSFFTPFSDARGASQDLPGLSVARLALPSIIHESSLPQPTGTPVGEKAIHLKKDIINLSQVAATNIQQVRNLYGKAIAEVDSYHRLVGEIEAKLQLGTTPANPNLIKLRDRASAELTQISSVVEVMGDYVNNFNATLQEANSLGVEINQTLLMPGALDEDHAHLLKMSEELDSFKTTIHQSLNILTGNAQRQKQWLVSERENFALLSSAIEKGKSQLYTQPRPHYPQIIDLPDMSRSPQTKPLVVADFKQDAPVEFVSANPKVHSVPETHERKRVATKKQVLYASQALKGRPPIAIVPANQEVKLQKWYLFATVQRELKSSHDKIEILNVTKS